MIKASWYATYINLELGITKEIIDSTFNRDIEQRQIDSLRARALQNLSNEIALVAREGDAVLGFARFKINDKAVELISMYVHPNNVARGIGTALWLIALKKLPAKLPVIVEVAAYTKAVEFYKKLGFVDTGKRRTAYVAEDRKIAIPLIRLIHNPRP